MITNRYKDSIRIENENDQDSVNTINSKRLYYNKMLNQKYYDKSKYPDFKLKESSDDILTSFKTKSNLYNTNYNDCNSFSSLDNNLIISYSNKEFNDSNLFEFNDNNNFKDESGGNLKLKTEEKTEKVLNDNSLIESLEKNNEDKETCKIDYKYQSKFIDAKNINEFLQRNNICKNEYCWLAVYDKLIKRKKIIKILKFYGNMLDESKLIEKCLKIDNFELFYNYNYNKPLIRPGKNFILVKLYLLSNEQINILSNYLNRVNIKININEINNNRNIEIDKGKYTTLFSKCKYYPYPLLYYLGNYMNINIISFSNYSYTDLNNNNISINNCQFQSNYPSSKKIAKFIKILMINFPDKKYNFEFFLFYVIANLKYINFSQKYLEINEIFNSYNLNNNSKNFDYSQNTEINKKSIIQKLKDKLINLEENDISDYSIINSNNSKMINSKLNSIITGTSFISNNFSLFNENICTNKNNRNSINKKSNLKSQEKLNKPQLLKHFNTADLFNLNDSYDNNKTLKNENNKNKKVKFYENKKLFKTINNHHNKKIKIKNVNNIRLTSKNKKESNDKKI